MSPLFPPEGEKRDAGRSSMGTDAFFEKKRRPRKRSALLFIYRTDSGRGPLVHMDPHAGMDRNFPGGFCAWAENPAVHRKRFPGHRARRNDACSRRRYSSTAQAEWATSTTTCWVPPFVPLPVYSDRTGLTAGNGLRSALSGRDAESESTIRGRYPGNQADSGFFSLRPFRLVFGLLFYYMTVMDGRSRIPPSTDKRKATSAQASPAPSNRSGNKTAADKIHRYER